MTNYVSCSRCLPLFLHSPPFNLKLIITLPNINELNISLVKIRVLTEGYTNASLKHGGNPLPTKGVVDGGTPLKFLSYNLNPHPDISSQL